MRCHPAPTLSQKHAKPSDSGFAVSQTWIDWEVLRIPKTIQGRNTLASLCDKSVRLARIEQMR